MRACTHSNLVNGACRPTLTARLRRRLEALHDAIRAGEECTGELLRLDEVSVRNEAQLARLCALLASARSSLAYVAQEERELVERLGEAEAETRAATAHFGSQVNESIYLDMLLEMGTGVEEHRESAADLGARSLHLLEQFSALQGRVNQQHATVGRLMDAADSVMNRASDMHAACSAAAAELEAAIEVAQIQAQILEGARARSPDQIAERLIDAALRRLHAALMGAR